MRNPTDAEMKEVKETLEKLEDVEADRQLLESMLRSKIHKLRRKCEVPGSAQFDVETYSKWVQRKQTKDGIIEIPLIGEE